MSFPKWLYELLPYLYVAFGTLAATGADPKYGRAAGVLLVVAGVVIYRMRKEYRGKL